MLTELKLKVYFTRFFVEGFFYDSSLIEKFNYLKPMIKLILF